MGVAEVIVFGWSLGGHIRMEMIPCFPGMRGLMIGGAPPVGHDQMSQGFKKSPHLGAAGKQELSEAEVKAFVEGVIGESVEPFLREAVTHADSRFRNRLFEAARAGEGVTQRHIVETSPVPVAAVNGGADRAVNLDYSSVA